MRFQPPIVWLVCGLLCCCAPHSPGQATSSAGTPPVVSDQEKIKKAQEAVKAAGLEGLQAEFTKMLPPKWTLRVIPEAEPYGYLPSPVKGVGFDFTGPNKFTGGKRYRYDEGFLLIIMPANYSSPSDTISAGSYDWFGGSAKYKIYYVASETPTWPGWEKEVRRVLGLATPGK